jgi:hypothetical protein
MSTTLRPFEFWRRSGCLEKAYYDAGLFGQTLLQAFLEMSSFTRGCVSPNPRLQRLPPTLAVVAAEPQRVGRLGDLDGKP